MIQYPKPSKFLMEMPKGVLFGKAQKIETWLASKGKSRPTLLDLESARKARK